MLSEGMKGVKMVDGTCSLRCTLAFVIAYTLVSALNSVFNSDHMHLIPRSHPSFPLPQSLDPSTETKEPSPLEVNSLGYAGMLLVKSPAELEALEKITSDDLKKENTDGHSQGIMGVLEYCGVPRHWGDKPEEHHGGAEQLMGALKGSL